MLRLHAGALTVFFFDLLIANMSQQIIRRNTLSVDLHQLHILPLIEEVHVLIQSQLPATVDNLLHLSLDTYKRQIYLKTISPLVAEKFLHHCGGYIDYVSHTGTYKLPVTLVEDDYITVTVATVPYECTNEQLKAFFAQYGDIARIVQLNHAKHLIFPIDSGRRLVVYKKLHTNIPQHVDLAGFKLRVSYSTQVKLCPLCGADHLKYSCALYSGDGNLRHRKTLPPEQTSLGPTVIPVNTTSRKRMLSNEVCENIPQVETVISDISLEHSVASDSSMNVSAPAMNVDPEVIPVLSQQDDKISPSGPHLVDPTALEGSRAEG